MLFQTGTTIKYVGVFIANKTGATGLTVTVTVYRDTTAIITGAAATPIAKGAYQYLLAAASNTTADNYLVVFETTDTSVDCKMAYGLAVSGQTWVQNIDGAITGIAAAVWAAGTRTLTSFGSLANDTRDAVWGATTRTLTGFGTLATDVRDAVWAATTRTLTAFGFSVSANNLPTDYALQTTLSDGLLAIVPKTNLIGTASVASRSDVNTARDVVIEAIEAGNAGTGPNSVTITVKSGANLLQNADVYLTINATRYHVTTDVAGEAEFGVETGDYLLDVLLSGYQFTRTPLPVNGDTNHEAEMTPFVTPIATDPDKIIIYGNTRRFYGQPVGDCELTLSYLKEDITVAGNFPREWSAKAYSEADGTFEFEEEIYPSSTIRPATSGKTHVLVVTNKVSADGVLPKVYGGNPTTYNVRIADPGQVGIGGDIGQMILP